MTFEIILYIYSGILLCVFVTCRNGKHLATNKTGHHSLANNKGEHDTLSTNEAVQKFLVTNETLLLAINKAMQENLATNETTHKPIATNETAWKKPLATNEAAWNKPLAINNTADNNNPLPANETLHEQHHSAKHKKRQFDHLYNNNYYSNNYYGQQQQSPYQQDPMHTVGSSYYNSGGYQAAPGFEAQPETAVGGFSENVESGHAGYGVTNNVYQPPGGHGGYGMGGGGQEGVDEDIDAPNNDDLTIMDKIMRVNHVGESIVPITVNEGRNEELFEGDVIKTQHLSDVVREMKMMQQHGLLAFDAINGGQWPKGEVPYVFDRSFNSAGRQVVFQAIAHFKQHTCINIRPWKPGDQAYVQFIHGSGCSSMIGRQGRRRQTISLGRGCLFKGIAIHELMHAIGFFHEQSRRDRDKYISINFNNISPNLWYNFQKYRAGQSSTLGEPYDKNSVMHYGNYAFSTNGQMTITSKSNWRQKLGQRNGLSVTDVAQINKYYNCYREKPVKAFQDKYDFCKLIGKWCEKENWVRLNCKETCCKDSSNNCSKWKKHCLANSYFEYMKNSCPRTCGFC